MKNENLRKFVPNFVLYCENLGMKIESNGYRDSYCKLEYSRPLDILEVIQVCKTSVLPHYEPNNEVFYPEVPLDNFSSMYSTIPFRQHISFEFPENNTSLFHHKNKPDFHKGHFKLKNKIYLKNVLIITLEHTLDNFAKGSFTYWQDSIKFYATKIKSDNRALCIPLLNNYSRIRLLME